CGTSIPSELRDVTVPENSEEVDEEKKMERILEIPLKNTGEKKSYGLKNVKSIFKTKRVMKKNNQHKGFVSNKGNFPNGNSKEKNKMGNSYTLGKKTIKSKESPKESKDTDGLNVNKKSVKNVKNSSGKQTKSVSKPKNKFMYKPGIQGTKNQKKRGKRDTFYKTKSKKPNTSGKFKGIKKKSSGGNTKTTENKKPSGNSLNVKNKRTEKQILFKKKRKGSSGIRIVGGQNVGGRDDISFTVIVLQYEPKKVGGKNGGDKARVKRYINETPEGSKKKEKNIFKNSRKKDKKDKKKKKDKNDKDKKKDKNDIISRECVGTLIHERYVLTTTSCCTYCLDIWYRKNKKILEQTRAKSKNQSFKKIKQDLIRLSFGRDKFNSKKSDKNDFGKVAKIYIPFECGKRLDNQTKSKQDGISDGKFDIVCPVILETKGSVELNEKVNFPACLPMFETFNRDTLIGGSVGWGQKSFKKK
ncbi:unnamed protein product, partial [Meganyctiphanes norvegica]